MPLAGTTRTGIALSIAAALASGACVERKREKSDVFSNLDGGSGGSSGTTGGCAAPVDSGLIMIDAGRASAPDPETCDEARTLKSYVGCDFWPTVTFNGVWSLFDFVAVVANGNDEPANVTVTRDGVEVATATVPPDGLSKIYLPWVDALKGGDADSCGAVPTAYSSVVATGGAFHLTSSLPVTVYQFNALEYRGTGGPPGKDWTGCPGDQICAEAQTSVGCFSFTNDASLLIPTPALSGNYRITSQPGWEAANIGGFFAITATEDGTNVTLLASTTGGFRSGGVVMSTPPGGIARFAMNRGDVVEVVGDPTGNLSGTLVQADRPVQVIAGMPCTQTPFDFVACDHVEEIVVPAETLGRRYLVAGPTGPFGRRVGHVVRLYGNVDGTELTYPGATPVQAPDRIDAGEVADLGVVNSDFEIVGTHEFAVGTFLQGAERVDPNEARLGDPSQSIAIAVEQYRQHYVFLAPDDYETNYIDIVGPTSAEILLDGELITAEPDPIGCSGSSVFRVKLPSGGTGAHVLDANQPVGMQVIGYGSFTSYQYPGGLNLEPIAPPPPPVK